MQIISAEYNYISPGLFGVNAELIITSSTGLHQCFTNISIMSPAPISM